MINMKNEQTTFAFTERAPHTSDLCMECGQANITIYVFLLGIFQLRLCRGCLGQLHAEIGEVLDPNRQ